MESTASIRTSDGEVTVAVVAGRSVAELLAGAGRHVAQPCGGGGRCGKCRVRATGNLSSPTQEERELLGAQLSDGWRLACVTRVLGDCTIWLGTVTHELDRVMLDGVERARGTSPCYHSYGLALDVGTTTIAAKLYGTAGVVAVATALNPQAACGADVVSRIGYSLGGGADELAGAIQRTLSGLVDRLCTDAGCLPSEVDAGVVTGNTAMLYLLTGRSPGSIATAPFAADWLAGEGVPAHSIGLTLAEGAQVLLPPCISAFVGADVTAAVLASTMLDSEQTSLLVDIGTNGEVALWHEGVLTCCSTAAGPAFEGAGITHGMCGVAGAIDHVTVVDGQVSCTVIGGGVACGLCGSAVIDTIAVMRTLGVIDETGYMEQADEGFALRDGVSFYQADVRAVQLAKSAICAGIETLVHAAKLELSQVSALYVAGGFGGYVDMGNAADIGLVPQQLQHCTRVIGNASLAGAAMLLHDRGLLDTARSLAAHAVTLDLAANPVFFAYYMQDMSFE